MGLDQLLEDITVHEPGTWENDIGPKDWYAVSDTTGIIAYFGEEKHAFNFRLALINAKLNPMHDTPHPDETCEPMGHGKDHDRG